MKESQIVDALRKENDEFKKLEQEHRNLDSQIAEMSKIHYLTTEQEMEKKKLQKKKLVKKDRMAEIIRGYKQSHSN